MPGSALPAATACMRVCPACSSTLPAAVTGRPPVTSSSRVSAQVAAVPWKPVLSVDTGQLQLASCCIASGPSEQLAVSLSTVVQLVAGGAIVTSQIAWLGISATELACFVGFWGLQVKLVCCHISAGLNGPLKPSHTHTAALAPAAFAPSDTLHCLCTSTQCHA